MAQAMTADAAISANARRVLSRHPLAIEVARAVDGLSETKGAQVVVYAPDRVFIAASTGVPVLQPRARTTAEEVLCSSDGDVVVVEGHLAVAVRNPAGDLVAAIAATAFPTPACSDTLRALARMLEAVLDEAADTSSPEVIERAIVENLRDAVVILDASLEVAWANRAVSSLFGRSPRDLVGMSATELLHPDDVQPALEAIMRLADGLETYRAFVRVCRGDGSYERVEVTGVDQSLDPSIRGLVLSLRSAEGDIELEATANAARQMTAAVIEQLHDGIVATDQFGNVTMLNDTARRLFVVGPGEPAASVRLGDLALFDVEGTRLDDLRGAVALRRGTSDPPVCVVAAGGGPRFVTVRSQDVRASAGPTLGTVFTLHDVTEARRVAKELERQAMHDQLTGLPNRRQLEARLHELSVTDPGAAAAVLFVDLDEFKTVNDVYGHRRGDDLIQIAAKRLRSIVTDPHLLVRQGGDEFVALLVGLEIEDDAVALATRAREALREPYILDGERLDLTASVGMSFGKASKAATEVLLRQADLALYAAKSAGRDRVEVFGPSLATSVETEERQRKLVRRALENDKLVMHYQPFVCPQTGTTTGLEALARIPDEHGNLTSPGAFVGTIDRSSLMWDLDRAAYDLSCRGAAALHAASPRPPTVACNFSPVSLQQPDFVEVLVETTERHGVEPGQICVEITESAAFSAGASNLETLRSLRNLGFLVALDDFGTGYSSLAHLRDFPLASVKVDRSFIAKVTEPSAERSIVKAVVTLANELGLETVAEGVETAAQFREAQKLGFSAVQGWYFSPALPLDEILLDWIEHHEVLPVR